MRTSFLIVGFVTLLAIITGGPLPHSRGHQVWGADPPDPGGGTGIGEPCSYYQELQNKKCENKDGKYCNVDWKKCRVAGDGEKNTANCVSMGDSAAACKDIACDGMFNPPNSDKLNFNCKQ